MSEEKNRNVEKSKGIEVVSPSAIARVRLTKAKGRKEKKINYPPPEKSGIKLEPDLFTKAKIGEKHEVIDSDKWHLVDSPQWLQAEAKNLTQSTYREVSSNIQAIINKAFSHSRNGTVAVLALGISLTNLKRELALLLKDPKTYEWGERREKIRVLKEYDSSEFKFDRNQDERRVVLGVVRAHIKRKETLMRKIAKEFGIEIPLDPQFTFFDDAGEFQTKIEKFLQQSEK
jgi:hypothetical protein